MKLNLTHLDYLDATFASADGSVKLTIGTNVWEASGKPTAGDMTITFEGSHE